jgi:hypothetical protein
MAVGDPAQRAPTTIASYTPNLPWSRIFSLSADRLECEARRALLHREAYASLGVPTDQPTRRA